MLQRLPIAPAQVQAGDITENLLFVCCLYWAKKSLRHIIIQLNQFRYLLNTIFMNPENRKTYDP